MLAIIITFYKRRSEVREVIEDPGSAIVHVVRFSEGLPDALTVALSVIYAILTFSIFLEGKCLHLFCVFLPDFSLIGLSPNLEPLYLEPGKP